MKNDLLELLPDWKFCKIERGVKGPRYANWQSTPYSLEQIPQDGNVGVLTGPTSNGLLAIDFDGEWAFKYWDEHIRIHLPTTVTWTSTRSGRCQMAFSVPREMWEFIKTIKISEETTEDRKPEGLEFRWDRVQSVLPPSLHPDTHMEYEWVVSPAEAYVQELPLEVLEWMLAYQPVLKIVHRPVVNTNPAKDIVKELVEVMEVYKKHFPNLDYDMWIKTTFSCMTHVGEREGAVIMNTFYPETESNEYNRLAHYYSFNRNAPSIGSLINRIRTVDPNYKKRWEDLTGAEKLSKRIEKNKQKLKELENEYNK